MGIGSSDSDVGDQIASVNEQKMKLKKQQEAQARQLQENRIQLLKGALTGQNLGLTKPTGPLALPSDEPNFQKGPFGTPSFFGVSAKSLLGD